MKLALVLTQPADDPSVVNTLGRQLSIVREAADVNLLVVCPRFERAILPGRHEIIDFKRPQDWRQLRRIVGGFRPDRIYARGALASAIVRVAGVEGPLSLDVRGLAAQENAELGRSRFRGLVLRNADPVGLARADRVQTVSNGLAALIRQRRSDVPITVVPNGVRYKTCALETGPSEPTLIFSGGGDSWQSVEVLLSRLKGIGAHGVAIRIFTHSSTLRSRALALSIPVSYVDPEDALSLYGQATALAVPRQDTLINRVASPIKVGEALASGVGLLATPVASEVLPMMRQGTDWLSWETGDREVADWLKVRHSDQIARSATREQASNFADLDLFSKRLVTFFCGD